MSYVIRFDFPEGDSAFAGIYKDALGWAPTIASAKFYATADQAAQELSNGYGKVAIYGRVVAVTAGFPVA